MISVIFLMPSESSTLLGSCWSERGLLEVVDRDVLKQSRRGPCRSVVLDFVAETQALGEEFVELHLLARGLERLGKLRFEKLAELVDIRHSLRA